MYHQKPASRTQSQCKNRCDVIKRSCTFEVNRHCLIRSVRKASQIQNSLEVHKGYQVCLFCHMYKNYKTIDEVVMSVCQMCSTPVFIRRWRRLISLDPSNKDQPNPQNVSLRSREILPKISDSIYLTHCRTTLNLTLNCNARRMIEWYPQRFRPRSGTGETLRM